MEQKQQYGHPKFNYICEIDMLRSPVFTPHTREYAIFNF